MPSMNPGNKIGVAIALCGRIDERRNSLVIFASEQIRRDRHIKLSGVSPALTGQSTEKGPRDE